MQQPHEATGASPRASARAPEAATAADEAQEAVAVEAEALGRRSFESWAAFDRYVAEYARGSFQLFRKRTSTSVRLRNRRLCARSEGPGALKKPRASSSSGSEPLHDAVASPPTAARLIPEHYANYSVTLVCTHSGAFVSRGTGKRARQEVRATRCDAQINACLKLVDATRDVYEVRVTRALLTHNHRLDRETFGQYSSTRLRLPHALLECVELMRRAGVKPRDIRAYIVEHSSCAPTVKDVQNLLGRLKHQADSGQLDVQPASPRPHELVLQQTPQPPPSSAAGLIESNTSSSSSTVRSIDAAAQFQMADAMGHRVARLLAGLSADRFADALRIMELAESIVLERWQGGPDAT